MVDMAARLKEKKAKWRLWAIPVTCCGVILALCLLARAFPSAPAEAAGPAPAPAPTAPPPHTAVMAPAPTAAPEAEEPKAEEPEAVPVPAYDFSRPAPEGEAVEDAWFSDAVFLGDSRTDGLRLYSGIRGADFLAYKALMVFNVVDTDKPKVIPVGDQKRTVLEALEEKQYGKVYIMFGINELGWGDDEAFSKAFQDLVDEIRLRQPDAVVYIQSLVPINLAKAKQYDQPSYITNEQIAVYNDILRAVCEEKQAVYVDVASGLVDSAGELPAEGSTDGIHFSKAWYKNWYEYLKTHTVDPGVCAAGPGQAPEET